jgi:hypothetical protein
LARQAGPIGSFPALAAGGLAGRQQKAIVIPFDATRTSVLVLVVPATEPCVEVRVEMAEVLCQLLRAREKGART